MFELTIGIILIILMFCVNNRLTEILILNAKMIDELKEIKFRSGK